MKKERAKAGALGPLLAGALCALLLVGLFLHFEEQVTVLPYETFKMKDEQFFASLDSMTADKKEKKLYLDGWAKDIVLYYGYNFGTDYSFFATLENTAFALTDGKKVVLLKCERVERKDVDALFKGEKRPEEGAPEKCGLHTFVTEKDLEPFGDAQPKIAIVSMRRNADPVIFVTEEKAVLP